MLTLPVPAKSGLLVQAIIHRGCLMPKAKTFSLKHDKRRKHHHWLVKVFYFDGESFGRVYIDFEKAERFAARQKKSPVVKSTRILQQS